MDFDFIKLNRKLDGIGKAAKNGKRVRNLHEIMRCPEIWQLAYVNIYSNKGAITKGVDDETLDGMSFERILKLINSIKSGEYRPKPVRRTYIPKKSGGKRPLGVPSGNDKLVQSVCKILLEQIYETIFHEDSHGFRPEKSCHTALLSIKHVWKGAKWFVEFDIKGCFDNINHLKLMEILEKRVDDKRFCKLIWQFLKAGYLEDWNYNQTYSGTPQGGIISPILANIYLHELDSFVQTELDNFSVGNKRPVNPEYAKLTNRVYNIREKLKSKGNNPALIRELKELRKSMQTMPSVIENTDEYKRLRYCRYADDFLFGVIGSHQDAKNVLNSIKRFLKEELLLQVSPEKTGIITSKKGVEFLGYEVKTKYDEKIVRRKIQGRVYKQRSHRGNIALSIPSRKMMEFCHSRGYGNWETSKPTHRPILITSSDVEIVEAFNAELRGFANYYILASNFKRRLSRLERLSWFSLAMTLASKYKTSIVQMFAKMKQGQDFYVKYGVDDNTKVLRVFKLKHMTKKTPNGRDDIPLTMHLYASGTELTKRMSAKQCEHCGRTDRPMEVHHVKKLKDLKSKPNLNIWEKTMIVRNRKTLVLCAGAVDSCHNLLHKGTLPDIRT
jgi:RNA-directed DNA polymerase